MNVLDSERMRDLLLDAGWIHAESEEDADLICFNTCCVRGSAEDRAFGRLTLLKPWKNAGKDRVLALCGCIAQKDGSELLDRFPFLDLVVGTRDYDRLPLLAERVMKSGERLCSIAGITNVRTESGLVRAPVGVAAFVTIMYGCDNYCSYCIVPYVRGRETSRSMTKILDEIRDLGEKGVRDVTLLGQNVNSYIDPETSSDFPDLLKAANDVPGIKRIRYTTSHPKDASEKLINAVAELDKVCENFHLPAQAGSNSVLKRMNRGYTREDYLDLTRRIRENVPEAVITTDLMVGFPGETKEDFGDTLDLAKRVRWNSAFTFIYSIRPGTEAAEFADDVPEDIKKMRVSELIHLQESISAEKNQQMLGKTLRVLAERPSRRDPKDLAGKDMGGRTVVFTGDRSLIGDIIPVKIVRTTPHTLIGEINTDES